MEKVSSIFKDVFKIVQKGETSETDSSFKELADSIKDCIKFENEKYSLESYLEIVGRYTDRLIITSEKNYMPYLGGECKVARDNDDDTLNFTLEMYFESSVGSKIKKTATRKIPIDKFTDETIQILGSEEKSFEIVKPEEA